MKICSICKIEKPLSDFHIDKKRGHGCRCKSCNRQVVKAWRQKNRESYNAKERKRYAELPGRRESHLRRLYGITSAKYEEMLEQQNQSCAICKAKVEVLNETLAVDHDHSTGAIRGLLCAKCNRMLGCANDTPDVLRQAADYLERAKAARAWIETMMECLPC